MLGQLLLLLLVLLLLLLLQGHELLLGLTPHEKDGRCLGRGRCGRGRNGERRGVVVGFHAGCTGLHEQVVERGLLQLWRHTAWVELLQEQELGVDGM